MSEILIFGGTTEGRRLSETLSASKIKNTLCVATDYGERVLDENPFTTVLTGRIDRDGIRDLIKNGGFSAVVDATHPYAAEITKNIICAVNGAEMPYFRIKRENISVNGNIRFFNSGRECAEALAETEGNILLTVGSKELDEYCINDDVKSRLIVRVLPDADSIDKCLRLGIEPKHIIAMQGPFTAEMNEAVIRQFSVAVVVSKDSGKAGGFDKKAEAAAKTGASLWIIGRPDDDGISFGEACGGLSALCGREISLENRYDISLLGAGPGSESCLTNEVRRKIENADIILGSARLIEKYIPRIEKRDYYTAEKIIPYLTAMQNEVWENGLRRVAILFSGDISLYSGCQSVYKELSKAVSEGRLKAKLSLFAGISSVSVFAARIGVSLENAKIISLHGKNVKNLGRIISSGEKTFLLTSGSGDIEKIGETLIKAGLEDCAVYAGFDLSLPTERVFELSPGDCAGFTAEGLCVCAVLNPNAGNFAAAHGLPDGSFIRSDVPMTKEEIREISISKLRLKRRSTLFDIGGGSGSVSVEAAILSDSIQVYTVEKKPNAAELIKQNARKHGLDNIEIITGEAPEALRDLPYPTHAFIGGSGGRMKDILSALYRLNPEARVVINAVTLETVCEINKIPSLFPVKNFETVQIQISMAETVGSHNIMRAQNPVWICSFEFDGKDGSDES